MVKHHRTSTNAAEVRRGGNLGAGLLAWTLSLMIHAFMAFMASRVDMRFLGRTDVRTPVSRYAPMQVREVDFSEDTQARILETLRDLSSTTAQHDLQAMDTMQIPPEVGSMDPPAAAPIDAATSLESAVPELTWHEDALPTPPRQEILTVEDAVVDDPWPGLERRDILPMERLPDVPEPLIAVATLPAPVLPDPDRLPRGIQPDIEDHHAWQLDMPDDDILGDAGEIISKTPDEEVERFEETMDEVTEIEPVDRVLDASIETMSMGFGRRYAYFRLRVERAGQELLPVRPRDFAFVIDVSGSISETRLELSREAVRRSLDFLGTADRFAIMTVGHGTVNSLTDAWVFATPRAIEQAKRDVASIRGGGEGDIASGLSAVFDLHRSTQRPVMAMVISDGAALRIQQRRSFADRGPLSVFVVGHLAQSRFEMLQVFSGWPNVKTEILSTGRFDMLEQIGRVMRETQRPVMSDVRFHFLRDADVEVYPRMVGNLYLDRPLLVYGRYRQTMDRLVLQAVGMAGLTKADMMFDLPLETPRHMRASGDQGIRNEFGRQKMYHLVSEYARTGNRELVRTMIRISREYNQPIPYRDAIGF